MEGTMVEWRGEVDKEINHQIKTRKTDKDCPSVSCS